VAGGGVSDRRLRLAVTALALAAFLGGPAPAAAHAVNTGLGPFYDGVGHLALTPEDLISVLALALLAGLRGKEHGRAALLTLPATWLAGGWLGLALEPAAGGAASGPAAGVVSLLVLGGLVAADLPCSRAITAALAAAVGLVHGTLNGGALAASPDAGLALAGVATAAFVLTALIAAAVARLHAPWTRVAVRVAGSWIAAVGLLMLGWWLRGSR
jgi:hydrogenase/urease accessory protein HupE